MPSVWSRWESLLLMLWWRRLGMDLLMTGRLVDQIPLARALLDHEEEPDYEAEEEDRVMRMRAARDRVMRMRAARLRRIYRGDVNAQGAC